MDFSHSDQKEDKYFNKTIWIEVDYDQQHLTWTLNQIMSSWIWIWKWLKEYALTFMMQKWIYYQYLVLLTSTLILSSSLTLQLSNSLCISSIGVVAIMIIWSQQAALLTFSGLPGGLGPELQGCIHYWGWDSAAVGPDVVHRDGVYDLMIDFVNHAGESGDVSEWRQETPST